MNPCQSKPVKTILSLSDEVLLNIFHQLEMCDMVQLSETCQRFQRILHDRTICQNLCIPWNIGISRHATITFIEQRSSIITSLTLTNINWISSYLIKKLVLNLPLLKGLHVAGTLFNWTHLLQVLKSPLPILDRLSWTYDTNLEKSIINQRKKQTTRPAVESNKIYDELLLLREKFQQFKYLLFHINKDSILKYVRMNFYGISFIASLCTNIEEFWMIGQLERNSLSFDNDLWNLDIFKLEFPNLHTLVVTIPSSSCTSLDDLPKIIHYLLASFHKNNVRNALDGLKSTMKLWMDPCYLSRKTDFPPGFSLSNLSWLSYGALKTDLDTNIDLSQLKKLAIEPCGGFRNYPLQIHKFLEHAPNLESFTCHIETSVVLDWSQIAVNNSKLKEVTVRGRLSREYEKFPDGCADIAKLSLLQKISVPLACLFPIIAPEIILQYNSDQELADNTMLQTPNGSSSNTSKQNQHQPPTGLDWLTLNCHNVKEFELVQKSSEYDIRAEFGNVGVALSNISRWIHLEYLTLCNLPLAGDGQFLIKVAESCKLKSLRLVHPFGKTHSYTECLYTALKLMPHLKDFAFEQNYIRSVTPLFEALQSCHKLQRLAVCVDANFSSTPLEADEPLKLMNSSPNLYLFYLRLSSASTDSCKFLTKRIIEQFKSSRPALNVLVTNIYYKDKKEFLNYVHHCDLMQCENKSCFKLYDSY